MSTKLIAIKSLTRYIYTERNTPLENVAQV